MAAKKKEPRLSPDGYDFEEYCLPWGADVLSIIQRMCRDREWSRDVVQCAWIRAWKYWPSFTPYEGKDPRSAARSWLITIAVHEFHSQYQSAKSERKRREKVQAGWIDVSSSDTDPRRSVGLVSDEVETALRKLDARSREMLERCDFRGERYQDIAAAMGIPIGTVMSGLSRARRRLAIELAAFARTEYRIERREPEVEAASASDALRSVG